MGLFSSKKIYVASTVQNLAGPEEERPNYLKTTVIGSRLAQDRNLPDVLKNAYIKGPGIKLRAFFRWANIPGNYEEVGLPRSKIGYTPSLDSIVVAGEIPRPSGQSVQVQNMEIGIADYSYWTEQWILENAKDDFDTNWSSDFSDQTGQITITWEDNSITSFTPTGFDKNEKYLYATYMVTKSGSMEALVTGSTSTVTDFPSVSGWALVTEDTDLVPVTRHKETTTIVSYSDATPGSTTVVDEDLADNYSNYTAEYTQEEYKGTKTSILGQDSTYKEVRYLHLASTGSLESHTTTTTTTEDMGGGVTKTTTVTVVEDQIKYTKTTRTDTQEVEVKSWIGPKIYIYQIGSGNAVLDAALGDIDTAVDADVEFFPFIPIRLNNEFLSETYKPEIYAQSKKGLKKAVTGKFDKIVEDLEDVESLPDIDHAYAIFGVSVNTSEVASLEYVYRFFLRLAENQGTTAGSYSMWVDELQAFQDSLNDWIAWRDAQDDVLSSLFGAEKEPEILPYPMLGSSKLTLKTDTFAEMQYNVELSWNGISESSGSGLGKPGAKKGDVWFDIVSSSDTDAQIYYNQEVLNVSGKRVDLVRMYWQRETDSYTVLDIVGMEHKNFVYQTKAVVISLREGIEDTDDSGFVVPLHDPTFRAMSLVRSTQMTTACCYILFNSYVIKKTGLLGSLFFKIFLIVVIILVIVFAPQLAPQLVQAAAATGAVLGLTGVLALIVGAAVNAIVGMIIASLVMKISVAVFGEKWGRIIGAALSIVAVAYGGSVISGSEFNLGSFLTSAQGIIAMTNALVMGVSGVLQYEASKIMANMQDMTKDYENKMDDLSKRFAENIGSDRADVVLVGLNAIGTQTVESLDDFLSRTLMTGTEVADFTNSFITKFTEWTVHTDLP